MDVHNCIFRRVFGRVSPHWTVFQVKWEGGDNPYFRRVITPYNKASALIYGHSMLPFPRKLREFKKLSCHYLVAENWKPCPIVRGSRGNIAGDYNMVAAMYDIAPHKTKLAL